MLTDEESKEQTAFHREEVHDNFTPYQQPQFLITFLSLSIAFTAGMLGTSTLWNQLRGNVVKDLGPGEASAVAWAWPTLLFTQTLSCIFFGRLSDLVGRRFVFVIGNFIAFIGFLSAGRAKNGSTVAGLCVLVGIGTGIQLMGPFLALAELVPLRQRFTVVGGCMSLTSPIFAISPAIAQAVFEKSGEKWRWTYSINAIFSFIAFIGLLVSYHPPSYKQLHSEPSAKHLKSKDWTGLAFLTVSCGLFTYFVLLGRSVWAWKSAQQITLTTTSGLFFVSVLIYELVYGHEHRAFPRYVLRDWKVLSQILIAAGSSVMLWFNPLAFTLLEQLMRSGSTMEKAWEISIVCAGVAVGWILGSLFLARPKWIKWQLGASVAIQSALLVATASVRYNTQARLRALLVLTGIGQGYAMVISHLTPGIMSPKHDSGVIVGLTIAARNLLVAIFLSVFESIAVPRLEKKTMTYISEGAIRAGLPTTSLPALFQALLAVQSGASTAALLEVPGINLIVIQEAQVGGLRAITETWHFVMQIAAAYLIPVAILALLGPATDEYLSNVIWVRLGRPPNLGRRQKDVAAIETLAVNET